MVVLFEQQNKSADKKTILAEATIPTVYCKHKIERSEFMNMATLVIDGNSITITKDGGSVTFQAVEGAFPEWSRVVPIEPTNEVSSFNSKYLLDFDKIAKIAFGAMRAEVIHSGENCAPVYLGSSNGFGALMPMLRGVKTWSRPDYA
jgi:hypothetical protein